MKRFMFGCLAFVLLGSSAMSADFELDGLKSPMPKEWKSEEVSSKMRFFQAKLPKAEADKEDADLVIFYFGKGSGGGVDDNIKRWKDAFTAPKDKKIDDVSKVEKFKIADDKVPVTYLTITDATYNFNPAPFAPNSKKVEKPGFSQLSVIVESENGPYFIRVTGPKDTVAKHKADFEKWIKGLKK